MIIGGGFAGLSAAHALRHAEAEVVLIDRRNHHIFQPLLYQAATAVLSPAEIAAPIRQLEVKQRNLKVPGQSQKANHAIAVVGYDDDTSSFEVANSWGSRWGEAGFARIETDAVVSRTLQLFVIDDLQIAAR